MKSMIFTLDALIGITILLLFTILIPMSIEHSYTSVSLENYNFLTKDLLNSLDELKVYEIRNLPTISRLLNEGKISVSDLNMSALSFIGSLYLSGNESIAYNITKELIGNLSRNLCINLTIENATIYSSCNQTKQPKVIATYEKFVSGYQVGKPVFGYVARAWVTKVVKNTTQIIPFYPEGSGWTARKLEVTKKFTLPNDVTILNATLYVSIHFGTSQSQAQFEQLKVNDVQKKNDIYWLYMQEESYGTEITTAAYGYVDVTNEITPGDNKIYLAIGTPNYHSHIHPGMRLVVTYTISQNVSQSPTKFTKRYYFDDVIGRTGAWSILSFYIPKNAENYSVNLHLNLKDIEDTALWMLDATDVLIFVNNVTAYSDGITNNCYYYTDKGYYCVRDVSTTKNIALNLDITNWVQEGTNIVSVYANAYGDVHWGVGEAEIYSDPITNPNQSSYIEVSYDLKKPKLEYGDIDITKEDLFGGEATNPKDFLYNVSQSTKKRLFETFVHIAQAFSSMLETYVNENLVFESPSPRAAPESVFIDSSYLIDGTNTISLRDVQPYGGLSSTNYFLPWSSVESTYIVKGLVGYGNVFNSSDLAINDAVQRLKQQIGEEGISATDIQIERKSVCGLRWLWGPSPFKVIVWSA